MEQAPLLTVACVLLGYACGTIPTGVLLTRRSGVDLRQRGSGNVGATNVMRVGGKRLGALTLLGDVGKAAVPTLIAWTTSQRADIASWTGLAAVVGHCYPLLGSGPGGKGVASALGALLVLCPLAAAVAVVSFAAILWRSRIVAVGSLATAAASPVAVWTFGAPSATITSSALMAALIWWRHRANLQRLRDGTEPRLTSPKKQAAA